MGKGIVKGVGGSTTSVKTVIASEFDGQVVTGTNDSKSTTPVGGIVTGFITDSQTNVDVPFTQPLGMEIGIVDGVKVTYNTVVIQGQTIANCVKLLERGVVETINATNDGGTIKDKSSKSEIPFFQQYVAESKIVVGGKVSYERVIDPNTSTWVAVCVEPK